MYLTFTKVYAMVPFETVSKPGGDRFESLRNIRKGRLVVSKEKA